MTKSRKNSLLEARISRIEKLLTNEARQRFERSLDVRSARAEADRIAQQFGMMLGVSISPDDLGEDVINSPTYGWLTINDVDEINDDPDARFTFQYDADGYTVLVIPSDNKVELLTEGGLAVDPSDGSTFEADDSQDCAFKLSRWNRFDLSMIDDYNESYRRKFNKSRR